LNAPWKVNSDRTAKMLGIAIPLPLSGRADELIE
jgi:hypothetical protein